MGQGERGTVEVAVKINVDVPPSPCLACGEISNAATTTAGDRGPKPGDFTICVQCGHLMTFADDLTLRNPNDAEMKSIAGSKDLIEMQGILPSIRRILYGKKT